MTSKNLFFKRMKQDLEQRIWLPVIFFIMLFLFMEMSLVSRMDNWSSRTDYVERMTGYLTDSFFSAGSAFSVITIVVAIISAISGFAYIHSAKKLDVYHSIPIKREALFIQQYCYGIVYYLIPMMIHVLICFGISVANGVAVTAIFGTVCEFMLIQLLIYLACYAVTIVAVCLTGNVVISVLGTGILICYSYVLEFLKHELMVKFFETYYSAEESFRIWAFSPVHLITNMISNGEHVGYIGFYVKLFLMAVIYTVAAVFLYKKRPTEAAGRTMTYGVTEPVVKTMVVFPAAITSGYVFASIISNNNDFAWFVFGCVFAFVIGCPIMEVIYRKDVKAVFHHPLQIVVNGVLVLAVVFSFKFDVFGYDTYVPDESKVESYAIAMPKLNHINSDYSSTGYCLQNMRITDNDSVRKLLEHGAELTRPARMEQIDLSNGDYQYTDFVVAYNLKNGEKIYRSYVVNTKDAKVMQWIGDMYNDMAYKQGSYPILTEEELDDYVGIILDYAYYSERIQLSKDRMQKFIETYQWELGQLKFEELVNENPVAELAFALLYPEDVPYDYPVVMEQYASATVYGEGVIFDYSSTQSDYKIYPSCKQTLALLEEYGARIVNEIPAEDVVSIYIEDYSREVNDNDGLYTKVVELEYTQKDGEQDKIAEILSALIPNRYITRFPRATEVEENIDVRINYYYDNKEMGKNCNFLQGKIPAFVLTDIEAAAKDMK